MHCKVGLTSSSRPVAPIWLADCDQQAQISHSAACRHANGFPPSTISTFLLLFCSSFSFCSAQTAFHLISSPFIWLPLERARPALIWRQMCPKEMLKWGQISGLQFANCKPATVSVWRESVGRAAEEKLIGFGRKLVENRQKFGKNWQKLALKAQSQPRSLISGDLSCVCASLVLHSSAELAQRPEASCRPVTLVAKGHLSAHDGDDFWMIFGHFLAILTIFWPILAAILHKSQTKRETKWLKGEKMN